MRVYKITDENDCTYAGFQWHEGKIHKTNGKGGLCAPGWIHFYRDKQLAVLLNPIHGNYYPFHLWLGEAGGKIEEDNGLKWGCTEFRMIKRVSIPKITLTQKVAFAILCALEIYADPKFVKWAEGWLQNKDRTAEAARAAAWAERTAAWAARAAAWAERTAAWAARAAAWAAVMVAQEAAGAVAVAAAEVARAAKINLVRLATECLKY